MILLAPILVFAMIAGGVRGRRAAANMALLAPVLSTAGVLLAAAAEFGRTAPYDGVYEWLNVATAFSGPSRFQNYIVDIGIRISHLTTVLMLAALLISFAVLAWSRIGARGEPSAARYYGLLTLLLACALGVVASTDLSEIYVFWGVGAVATYLLLSNSWSDEAGTRAGRLALAVPAVTDLALLAGIALLYSRFGQLNIDQLIVQVPLLGIQPKTQVVASILIFAGAAGRLGLFPFHAWLTGAGDTPAGASAAVQGFWTLMAAGLLFKAMPIFVSSFQPAPTRLMAATAAVTVVALPLVALATLDARRVVTASGIALSAVAVISFAVGNVAPAALLLAVTGIARAGAVMATGSLVSGMRTPLLPEMGEGWRRMRLSVLALVLAALASVAGAGVVAGGSLKWYWTAAFGLGLGLGVLGLLRVYLVAGHGRLPRRRGFDPNRVRPAPDLMAWPPIVLGAVALALAVLLFSQPFLFYVDHRQHPLAAGVVAGWAAIPIAAALVALVLFFSARATGARLTASAAAAYDGYHGRWRESLDRLLVEPSLELAERADDGLVAGGEERLAGAIGDSARVFHRSPPPYLLPVLVAVAVLVAVIAGLVAPGVYR